MATFTLQKFGNLLRRQPSRRASTLSPYRPGDAVHGYIVKRIVDVNEFSITAVELEHSRTKSQHIHLARDDKNNVFNVSLQTMPMNSTGVAHVLEHVVLCGSEKFPVRDPFFKMLDRSMSTFMNAMTGADYTMYPFATQNQKDFQNLLSVYLDSVFFPQIRKLDFMQEGWRLEHENNKDSSSPIIFKGVVFNEMKGMLADPSYLFGTALLNHLMPDHTYGVCSGGKPDKILDLTWQDLKNFHAKHYHPSNARFITYGNFPMEDHLQQINEQVMSRFEEMEPGPGVPMQPKWTQPKTYMITCPPDNLAATLDKQTSFSISYLLPEVSDIFETFTADVLCTLLMDGPASPLYKSLIESGVGTTYSPQAGYHSHQKEALFSIGLQGISPDDVNKVKDIIEQTMDDAARDPFPSERIESVLHRVELQHKHQSSKFGLGLTFNVMPLWQHGADPAELMKVDGVVAKFRQQLEDDPEFLQKKCRQYFTDNPHRLCLTMSPDQSYMTSLNQSESEKLSGKLAALSEAERKEVFDLGCELLHGQEEKEDVTCLPTLHVVDIPKKQENYEVDVRKGHHSVIVTCPQPTNGVTYFDAIFPVNGLSEQLKAFLPLFGEVLTQMGTTDTDYVTFSQREDLYTGGLNVFVTSSSFHSDPMISETAMRFHSYCLDRNVDKMFALWKELFNKVIFEDEIRLHTLVRQSAQQLANSVSFNGHMYAMRSASQFFSPSCHYNELFNGLTQVQMMRRIAELSDLDDVISKLRQIAGYVLRRPHVMSPNCDASRYALHSTPPFMSQAITSLEGFVDDIKSCDVDQTCTSDLVRKGDVCYVAAPNDVTQSQVRFNGFEDGILTSQSLHTELPLPVNFVSTCLRTPCSYTHPHNPVLRVLARLMSAKFLHREIREMGGAYGGGAKQGDDGVLRFYSYRDPNNTRTVKSFEKGVRWLCEGSFTQQDIDEAKLTIFQAVDSPVSPCGRGLTFFLSGVDDVIRQDHRNRLLDVNKEQIVDIAQKYLAKPLSRCDVILGPSDDKLQGYQKWEPTTRNVVA